MLPCRTSVRPLYTYEAEHSLGGRNTATEDKHVLGGISGLYRLLQVRTWSGTVK